MQNEQQERLLKATRTHLAMEAAESLLKLEEFPDNPGAMRYFYDLFRNLFTEGGGVPPHTKPLIGTMCVQVPEELIHASGAVPLRLCSGSSTFDQIGGDFMPAKSCPVVKATIGMLHANQALWNKNLKAVIIPTTCDQKRKSAELLDNLGFPVHTLEMPPGKESELSRFFWQESVKGLVVKLEKLTGQKITASKLKQSIAKLGRASDLFRQLLKLRQGERPVILGKDLFLVANAFFVDDLDRWLEATQQLVTELEVRQSQQFFVGHKHAPRLLFTGSPPIFPNLKLPVLIEQAGGVIVADEVCSSNRLLYDAVAYAEENLNDMVPAIADRYLKPCTCPCLTANQDRTRKLLEMAQSARIDGVVYQAFSGCMPYEMEQRLVAKKLEEAGIPMLYVETDYSPEDMGQLSTRVEAFIESIKTRKRKAASPPAAPARLP